jgi:hypothetical protein
MEWGKTFVWVIRGGAAGFALFLAMVVAVYALVPLESDTVDRIVQVDAG